MPTQNAYPLPDLRLKGQCQSQPNGGGVKHVRDRLGI